MGHVTVEFAMDFPAYKEYISLTGAGDNTAQRTRMKRALSAAMTGALTIRQRQMLMLHYFDGQSVTAIALQLGLNKSTVSRHLTRARTKLSRVLNYSLIGAAGGTAE